MAFYCKMVLVFLLVTDILAGKPTALQREVDELWDKYGEIEVQLTELESNRNGSSAQTIKNIQNSVSELDQTMTSIRDEIAELKSSLQQIKQFNQNG